MSDHPESGPTEASPFRLNLEQQRRRARELLDALHAGDAAALGRFRLHHPRLAAAAGAAQLSDAQLVIARELGLPSWPRLKAHIEAMDRSLARIRQREAAPDGDMPTLHLRCGSDIRPVLKQAGFAGDFLEYSDPLCQGPVMASPDWLERRADFVARVAGADRGEILGRLSRAEEGLRAAATSHARVVLWFEHDSYDQLILARCLARFAAAAPARLELVSAGHYPGRARFIGLGQLPPEALRLLWDRRVKVTDGALRQGRAAWDVLRAPDPTALAALARAGTPELPQLGRALRRHAQELPWTGDGLSLTQRLTLELLAEAPHSVAKLFARLMLEREPLPWMSDLLFRAVVEDMRQAQQPVFTGAPRGESAWTEETLTITSVGRAVVGAELDWLSLRPPTRWLGGVELPGTTPCWRWDEAGGTVVHR
jgi:hypothetical protein